MNADSRSLNLRQSAHKGVSMPKQFAVIGLGRFGSSVARALCKEGREVLAIDEREDLIKEISDSVTQAVQLDATDEKSLKAVGIKDVDCAIVSIGQKVQDSILVTILLKEMGIPRIVAKASNPLHGRVLEKVGADMIVFPERDMGTRVAHSLIMPTVLEEIELSPGHNMREFKTPPEFVGKTLSQLDLRAKYGANVVAIKQRVPQVGKAGKVKVVEKVNVTPKADDRVCEDDILVIIGQDENLSKLDKHFQETG